ncbi:MAG: oxidoreductase [Eggerthellaceae bacterium]|nr:oxidoreductase [Eggerthellaceae bacterium]
MAQYGILVDYEWCSGCHTCEVACQMEHGMAPDHFGVKITELGPWQVEGKKWQHLNYPNFTIECDLCADRLDKGKTPICVSHCQAKCLVFGTVEELVPQLVAKPQQMLVVPC